MNETPNDWHRHQSPPNTSAITWVGGGVPGADHGHLPLAAARDHHLAEYAEAEAGLIAARKLWRDRHDAVRDASRKCDAAVDAVKAAEAELEKRRSRLLQAIPSPTPIEGLLSYSGVRSSEPPSSTIR